MVYNARKFNFTGYPVYPRALQTYAFGATTENNTTVSYVSWNGVTEVADGSFMKRKSKSQSSILLVARGKTGLRHRIYQTLAYVEGFDAWIEERWRRGWCCELVRENGHGYGRIVRPGAENVMLDRVKHIFLEL